MKAETSDGEFVTVAAHVQANASLAVRHVLIRQGMTVHTEFDRQTNQWHTVVPTDQWQQWQQGQLAREGLLYD